MLTASSIGATHPLPARSDWCQVAGPATSHCMVDSSDEACSTPLVPERSSRRRLLIRCSKRPRVSTRALKNYTGDVMNFEMAAELAAAETGIPVETVVINDDVAVEDSLYTAGRRGVGVTVMLEKLVGAAAEEGRPLSELVTLARSINGAGRSMGMALTSCTVPAAGKPTFELGMDEMELGIGIHGEPGRRRVPLATAREIAEHLMEPILADRDFTLGPVIVMLNGMGGTPLIELYVMYGEVAKIMERAGITVARNLVGNYITSLEMAGCSVTVLQADEELVRLWDSPVNTAGLRWGI